MVKRHQVSPRALGQGIASLELSKCRPVVALLQMRELVYEQVVEDQSGSAAARFAIRIAPEVNVQLPQRCDMSAKTIEVHRSRPPKCRSLSALARPASLSSEGFDRSTRFWSRRLMTSAHLWRSACDIQSGTSSSMTPARSRAETVRRRFRVATMRMGGGNAFAGLFKSLCSDVARTGCSKAILGAPMSAWKPWLLRAFSDTHP